MHRIGVIKTEVSDAVLNFIERKGERVVRDRLG